MYNNKKILIIGLGNPILGDDGIGWHVAEKLRNQLFPNDGFANDNLSIDVESLALGGIRLMEELIDYHHAIIIDAIQTGKTPIGTVTHFSLEDFPTWPGGHTGSSHDTNFTTAMEMGRKMKLALPDQIDIIGIEAENIYEFSEKLSPQVEKSIPEALMLVNKLLGKLREI